MDKIDKWIERIRGLRKWSIMLLLMVVGVSLRVNDLLTGVEFVSLLKDVAVGFMASNAIEHARYFLSNKKDKDVDEG